MKTFILFLSFFSIHHLYSMRGDIKIDLSCKNVNSPFSHVILIDNRNSNQYLGYVQTGMFNEKRKIFYDGDFKSDVTNLFINPTINGDTLILIVDKIYLSEKTQMFNELGFVQYKMRMFMSSPNGSFRCIYNKNDMMVLKAFDITKTLKKGFNDLFCELSNYATKSPRYVDYQSLSFSDVFLLDSFNKLKLPIYVNENVNKGVFHNFSFFQKNQPLKKDIVIENINDRYFVYEIDPKKNKKRRMNTEDVYAVSDGEITVINTVRGFKLLKKENFDFYYEDYLDESNPNAAMAMSFGIIGAAIASAASTNDYIFIMKMDYETGEPIPVRKVKFNKE